MVSKSMVASYASFTGQLDITERIEVFVRDDGERGVRSR